MKDKLRLAGKHFLNTRATHQAQQLSSLLEKHGATVCCYPTLEIEQINEDELRTIIAALSTAKSTDWLVFTSPNGAQHFAQLKHFLTTNKHSFASPHAPQLAVIGKQTETVCREHGLEVSFHGLKANSAAFATEFIDRLGAEQGQGTLFLLRGDTASSILPQKLRQAGHKVQELVVYHSRCPSFCPESATAIATALGLRSAVEIGQNHAFSLLIFTSSEALKNFVKLLSRLHRELPNDWQSRLRRIPLAVIGPLTATTARNNGFQVAVQAQEASVSSLVSAIIEYYSGRN